MAERPVGTLASNGAESVRAARMRDLPSIGYPGPRAQPDRSLSASRSLLEDGRTVIADENYMRESILESERESGERIQAHHADIPGPRE